MTEKLHVENYDQKLKGLLIEVCKEFLELQWEIEKLPPSTKQTDVSIKAHELRKKLIKMQAISTDHFNW